MTTEKMTTESTLRDWRYGQTQAERLVAALLHLEGFEAVDPQHPLGGPDGLKDVLCKKDGISWVAAAYFPTTAATFPDIKSKFKGDFKGVASNNAEAFAFFVNQSLTVGERQRLTKVANQMQTEIYHLERMVSLLNAPKGCGIRLEYLRIPMTEEEQWAFWNTMNEDIVEKLAQNEKRRDAQIRSIDNKLDQILRRSQAIEVALLDQPSRLRETLRGSVDIETPTATLSLESLCWLHRVIAEDSGLPEAVRGHLRSVNAWVGVAGSGPDTGGYVPPPPDQVVGLISEWIGWWKKEHRDLQFANKDAVVAGLAEFHHMFLRIHPFLDANGRLARILLDQAARELLGQGIGSEFTNDAAVYFAALAAADSGDMVPLRDRIAAALN
jgi:hypothetical protein